MFLLQKDFTFEAAHQLPNHDGKCARLHGHSWKGTVYVASTCLIKEGPKSGMVMDYADIKAPIQELVQESLDHYYLNESLGLPNPTSEAVAAWVFVMLEPHIPGLVAVMIQETCTARCIFTKPELNTVLGEDTMWRIGVVTE